MRSLLVAALGTLLVVSSPPRAIAAGKHPDKVTVNGRSYRWPLQPTVVILVDGNDPEYLNAGFATGLFPNMRRLMDEGFATVALGGMPSFTNPNNVSVVTGVSPAKHGISGNYFLDPKTGKEVMMNSPEYLRVETILAVFSRAGAHVVALTAKDKLAKMLAHGLDMKTAVTFSAEKANACNKKDNGIEDCLGFVGRPLPDQYSGDLSLFVLEAGAKLLERDRPDLLYVSTSDYIQHTYPPGSKEANAFYAAIDGLVGRMLAAGATVALTADHGMNDKSRADGSPNVVFLQDVLDAGPGAGRTKVILPITDPYVKHHGALGSFATVFLGPDTSPVEVTRAIHRQPGMEQVLSRKAAAALYELPADRIGDLIVIGDRNTVIGTRKADHDLTKLAGHRLRSHGGLAERNTVLMFSRPLTRRYAETTLGRPLRNSDVFDIALNGLEAAPGALGSATVPGPTRGR
jgi:phosphonoacetate hydrolase